MKRTKGILVVLIALLLLLPAAARAQQKGMEITTVSEVEMKQKNAEGKEEVKRIDATKTQVLPGQTVFYTNYYSYNGNQPATNVVIKNPIPEHMVYVDGSAQGKGTRIEFSADNGKTFAPAGKLLVKDKSGKERAATAADYTTIRWTIEKQLTKGAKGSVTFNARVK